MSDYTKTTDFTAKDNLPSGDPNKIAKGSEVDTEFDNIESAIGSKANKIISPIPENFIMMSSTGDLQDSGVALTIIQNLTGEVKAYAGSSAPSGWLLCYGQAVSRTIYADLYAIVGTTYGAGDGSLTFNVPDLRGRVPVGADNMGGTSADRVTGAWADSLGGTDGAETHTLTEAELPAHVHTGTTDSDGAHTHTIPGSTDTGTSATARNGGVANGTTITTSSNGPHTHTFTTSSIGSDTAHNNMQPSIALNYIIKT